MHDGRGLLYAGIDVDSSGEGDFLEWHTREHLVERLGLPGFLRGRRFVARNIHPRYFILYDVEDLSVLAGSEYLECLNNPTPWTQRTIRNFRNGFRSACRVVYSSGVAEGGFILVVRLSNVVPDQLESAFDALPDTLLSRPGVTRVRLAVPDLEVSTIDTRERRESGNDFAEESILLVEAIAEESLVALLASDLASDQMAARGLNVQVAAVYQLQVRMGGL